MNQLVHGVMSKSYAEASRERFVSFSFPLKGYGRVWEVFSQMKKVYEKSFLHDFQNVMMSKVK